MTRGVVSGSHSSPLPTTESEVRKILHALETSRPITHPAPDERGIVLKRIDWECGRRLENVRHEHGSSVAKAELVSQLLHDAHAVDNIKATLSALLASISDLQEEFQSFVQPIVFKLSTSLSSLPEELIALVFKFTCIQVGTKQAVWLSHVSRKFRRIALSEVNLWTTLHSSARLDEIETYITRSGEADLHVVVDIKPDNYHEDITPFSAECANAMARWRSLSISAVLDDDEYPVNAVLLNELTDLEEGGLTLPRLREVDIFHLRDGTGGMESESFAFWEFSPSWDAPALSIVRCQDFIPSPTSTPFTSISSLSLSLNLVSHEEPVQIRWLLEYLESTPTMTELDLKIYNVTDFEVAVPLSLSTTSCPSLASFSIHVSPLPIPSGAIQVLAPLIGALQMPKLQQLKASVGLDADSLVLLKQDDAVNTSISFVAQSLLPDPLIHRQLASLSLEFSYQWSDSTYHERWTPVTLNAKKFTIPLNRIPFVHTLSLTTPFYATFTSDIRGRAPAGSPLHSLMQYGLRELHLKACENMVIWQLQEMVQSLKEFGAWAALEKVIMEECSSISHERALEAVGFDRLEYVRKL